eukprot:15478932-Alexandrium_andersonii.AAC.1
MGCNPAGTTRGRAPGIGDGSAARKSAWEISSMRSALLCLSAPVSAWSALIFADAARCCSSMVASESANTIICL